MGLWNCISYTHLFLAVPNINNYFHSFLSSPLHDFHLLISSFLSYSSSGIIICLRERNGRTEEIKEEIPHAWSCLQQSVTFCGSPIFLSSLNVYNSLIFSMSDENWWTRSLIL